MVKNRFNLKNVDFFRKINAYIDEYHDVSFQ